MRPLSSDSHPDDAAGRAVLAPAGRALGAKVFAGGMLTQMFVYGITIVQGVLLARLLGPGGRGAFAGAILWPLAFGMLGTGGMQRPLLRRAAQLDEYRGVFRCALKLTVLTTVLTCVGGYFALPFLLPADEKEHILPLARMALGVVPLIQCRVFLQAVFQGKGDFRTVYIVRVLLCCTYAPSLAILFILGVERVDYALACFLLGHLAQAVFCLIRAFPFLVRLGEACGVRSIVRQSGGFFMASITNELYHRIDQVLVLWFIGSTFLGYFMVAKASVGILQSLLSSMGQVSLARTARCKMGEGFGELASVLRKAVVVAVILIAGGCVAVPLLLPILYGPEFAPSIRLALIMVIGTGAFGLAQLVDLSLHGQSKAWPGIVAKIVGVCAMAVATFIFVGVFGDFGVAVAFTIAQLTVLALLTVFLLRVYDGASGVQLIPRMVDLRRMLSLGTKGCRVVLRRVTGG